MARSVRWIVLLAAVVALSRCSCGSSDEPACPAGQELCRGVCVDTATYANDPLNCGACAVSCGNGTCAAGTCQCSAPEELCASANPRCTDTQTDRLNCGSCGNACTRANDVCQDGSCQCLAPFTQCSDTVCTNLQTDATNCGTCGNDCPLTNEVCADGGCACPTGLPDVCGSTCVNLATDTSNCLTCGNVCAAGASCTPTGCFCPDGESVCGAAPGVCVNTSTDESNCGTCGRVCPAGATCSSGSCTCPSSSDPVLTCGGDANGGGTCCVGNGCCGTGASATCQTKHANGVGGSYFDCVALGTYDAAQAAKAASSWQPQGQAFPGSLLECPGCLGWQTPQGTSPAFCGTWCYAGPLTGKVVVVQSLVCTCAALDPGTWN